MARLAALPVCTTADAVGINIDMETLAFSRSHGGYGRYEEFRHWRKPGNSVIFPLSPLSELTEFSYRICHYTER